MQYVTDLSKYQTENRTAVTLGKFDGLHPVSYTHLTLPTT